MVTTAEIIRQADPAPAGPASPVAVASIVLSMALMAVGNGLLFAYIPVRLGADGFEPTWAAAIITGLSAGGIASCLLTSPLVRRVGHARAYMALSALIVLSNTLVGFNVDPILWVAARALYGFAICALFIVSQSWLNDAVENRVRGRVMAIFYVAYVVGLGGGYALLPFVDMAGAHVPLIGIAFTALSMLPVGLTRLAPPPVPQRTSLSLAIAWKISPVGLTGMLAAGALSMLVTGFAPIHATAIGYTKQEVATLLLAMPIGTLLFQIPLGWISDRTDRRYVLVAAALLVMLVSFVAIGTKSSALPILMIIFLVASGACDSIYSIASAHANDRADKDDLVALSSSMMLAWSVAGFLAPGAGTIIMGLFGTASFLYLTTVIAAAFALFVIWRVVAARAAEPSTAFAPMSAQAPMTVQAPPQD